MYFIGREAGGANAVGLFMFDGAKFEKVSTVAVDKILAGDTWYSVSSIGFGGQYAIAISLAAPNATTQRWLMFFPRWNEWFEWTSTVFQPVNTGHFFLGVAAPDKIYYFGATDNWQDNGTNYTWTHQFKWPKKSNDRQIMPMFGVKGDTARSASSLNVEFSRDDYATFETARVIDMTSAQKMLTRCGQFTDLSVRLSHTANLDVRIEAALARVE